MSLSDNAIHDAMHGHRNRNLALRAQFEKRGVNLDQPRSVDFHFWASTQRDAAVLARSLYEKGFLIHMLAPAPGENAPDRWSIEGGLKIPLTLALGERLTEELIKLASAEDATFDGWGTSI